MSAILGINFEHADSAACVVIDGKLRAAVAEERLGPRIKHSPAFPEQAIRQVLDDAAIAMTDVTHVAVARNPRANIVGKVGYTFRNPRRACGAVSEHLRRNRRAMKLHDRLAAVCDVDPKQWNCTVVPVEHHLAHIASAYYLSPYDSLTAGWSYDASGDFASAMAARCEGNRITPIARVLLPHSLGFFYTAICQFIGFDQFGEEYKVMGLASYGEDCYSDVMRKLVYTANGKWFRLNAVYFGMHQGGASGAMNQDNRLVMGRMFTDRLIDELGQPRPRETGVTQREKNLAKSCQVRFEEVAIHCLQQLHRKVPTENLVMAGGCALNGVANARILRDTPFQNMYLQAASSDDGTCLGAAYWVYHAVLGETERFHMQHANWGPEYSEDRMHRVAQRSRYPWKKCEEAELLSAVAEHLRSGHIVGWYQGRSEWGPRALGNRSILVDPSRPDAKDILNQKIKRREGFRPFAPSVLSEYVGDVFEQDVESPFMMHVVKIKPSWQAKLPAVTHVDGTGRLQSVTRRQNKRYYDLIDTFRQKTGIPLLLNTSFNENEPIVDTPEQALDCFRRTDMDVLVLGNHIITR